MDKCIHIIPAPVIQVFEIGPIFIKSFIISKGLISLGIGIKVIIKMNPINVIVPDNIHNDTNNILTNFRQARIEELFTSISKEPLWFLLGNVICTGVGINKIKGCPIRIEPGM